MRHIKFEFAEPLVAIQRVRNEVFLGDDVTPPSDLDIDEGYEEMCNRVGCDYL